jgi:hypothetical protein
MPDYNNTVIYKICCKDETITDIYIGHTTNFKLRINAHKCCCNNIKYNKFNRYVYKFILENGGWDNWNVIVIEEYPCNDKNEASIRERYWIEKLKSSLNTEIPSRTNKEYDQQNAEKIEERRKEQITCECGYVLRKDSLRKHQQRQKHKDLLLEKLISDKTIKNSPIDGA